MEIDRPIFFIGFGRSGSTHIYRVFSFHPRLAWLSKMADDYPHKMWINSATLGAFGATPFAELIARKMPAREGWRYWDAHFPGFSEPFRDLTADDVTPHIHERMQRAVARIRTPSRDRILMKLTGWPRISFLQEIFPDARFIHILRDGRAAVNSLVQTEFWGGWQGPSKWRWGPLTPEQTELWERWDRSFIALAALQWKKFVDAMAEARVHARNFTEVRYEDLCASPMQGFQDLVTFCELDWHPKLEAKIRRSEFRNTNYKWKNDLTPRQQEALEALLGELCAGMGYD